MKLTILLVLTSIFLSSCKDSGSAAEATAVPATTTAKVAEVDSSKYYGSFNSECISSNGQFIGDGFKYEMVLGSSSSVITIKMYGESDCRTLMSTTVHTVDFYMTETKSNEPREFMTIDWLTGTSLQFNHAAYMGYNNCGFAINDFGQYDISGLTCSGTTPIKEGQSKDYFITDNGDGTFYFQRTNGTVLNFTVTKI